MSTTALSRRRLFRVSAFNGHDTVYDLVVVQTASSTRVSDAGVLGRFCLWNPPGEAKRAWDCLTTARPGRKMVKNVQLPACRHVQAGGSRLKASQIFEAALKA